MIIAESERRQYVSRSGPAPASVPQMHLRTLAFI